MSDTVSIKELIMQQFKMYPRMKIQDVVKLLYQNEFAGGHLISDVPLSLAHMQKEITEFDKSLSGAGKNLYEGIGNNLCRLNLSEARKTDIRLQTVNQFFVSTANSISGTIPHFAHNLAVFRQICFEKDLPFPIQEVDDFLIHYQNEGYPQVGHSEEYRLTYNPSYRVIKTEYMRFFEIFCAIDSLFKGKDTACIAIDGNSGAGKSSLASLISEIYESNIYHMDHFFLQNEQKTRERLEEIGGNVDYVRFRDEVIAGIESGKEHQYQIYNCKEMSMKKSAWVMPQRLSIIEGSYSMHPTLACHYDLKIFLRLDEREQIQRILKRDGALMQERFKKEWIPMENRYFSNMKIMEQCDLVY